MLLQLLTIASLLVFSFGYDAPGQTFDAKSFTNWAKFNVKGSRKALIDVSFKDDSGNDDYIKVVRLDLVGDAEARGFAAGSLLCEEIVSSNPFYFLQVHHLTFASSWSSPDQSWINTLPITFSI
jgi:hypothetical protein